jgi:hypothetical protein
MEVNMVKHDLLNEETKPLLRYNLQYFAEKGADGDGADGTGDNGDDNQDEDQDNQDTDSKEKSEKQKEKTFTQKELDDAIEKRLKREREKNKKKDSDGAEKTPEDKAKDTDNKVSALEAKLLCFEHDVAKDSVSDVVALAKAYVDEDTDFEEAIEKVIKKYPQFVKGADKKKSNSDDQDDEDDQDNKGSWGQRQTGKNKKLDPVEEAFYKKNPELK